MAEDKVEIKDETPLHLVTAKKMVKPEETAGYPACDFPEQADVLC